MLHKNLSRLSSSEDLLSSNTSFHDLNVLEDLNPVLKKHRLNNNEPIKREKRYSAEIIIELKDRNDKVVPARALCDTGCSGTIILKDKVQKGRVQSKKKRRTKWKMYGGIFTTRYKSLIDFKMPEFDNDKVVTWACNVDDKTPQENAPYDMIIGMDLMTEIGIVIDCEDKVIKWEGQDIPMKEHHLISSQEVLEMMYLGLTCSKIHHF